jgi:hypothetical protein
MSWDVTDQEYQSVIELSAAERYAYFVKKVSDFQELWSLRNAEGWVLMADSDQRQLVPVWPNSRYARACATDHWRDCQPSMIGLDDWLEKWTPGVTSDDRGLPFFQHHRIAA